MIGILAAIAIPNYSAYIQRGHRSDAKAALMLAAQWQERFRRETNNYSAGLPAGMTQTPATGTARYNIAAVAPAGAGTFTITATRAGAQAGDECGNFTINQLGQRGLVGNAAGTTIDTCWGR
jgi:type IV pilus assembly protein PilE